MSHAVGSQATCAHVRVVYQPVDAGEVMEQATESFPGGLRHLVRDEWKCDACGSTFFPFTTLLASEMRGFQRGAQAQRKRDALLMEQTGKRIAARDIRTAPPVTELPQ